MTKSVLVIGPGAGAWAGALERAGLVGPVEQAEIDELTARRPGAPSGGEVELILVQDVCARLDDEANGRLVRHLARRAAPGAVIVIADAALGDGGGDGGRGSSWPLTSYGRWLTDAGFRDVCAVRSEDATGTWVHASMETDGGSVGRDDRR